MVTCSRQLAAPARILSSAIDSPCKNRISAMPPLPTISGCSAPFRAPTCGKRNPSPTAANKPKIKPFPLNNPVEPPGFGVRYPSGQTFEGQNQLRPFSSELFSELLLNGKLDQNIFVITPFQEEF